MKRLTITLSDEDSRRLSERCRKNNRGAAIEAQHIIHDALEPVVDTNPEPWREWDVGRTMAPPQGVVQVQYRSGRQATDKADVFMGWNWSQAKPWIDIVAWRPAVHSLPDVTRALPVPVDEPWRTWNGIGRRPSGKVQVRFRDVQSHGTRQGARVIGYMGHTRNARDFVWTMTGGPDDIIEWRPAP